MYGAGLSKWTKDKPRTIEDKKNNDNVQSFPPTG